MKGDLIAGERGVRKGSEALRSRRVVVICIEREVTEGFIEFAPYLGLCRFRDCRHRQEPGCAIRDAIDEGAIHPERFASYRRIVDSLDSQ